MEELMPRLNELTFPNSALSGVQTTSYGGGNRHYHDSDALFRHEELDTSRDQIRLVQFCPADTADGIKFRITICELGEIPYHALSYVWGPPAPVQPIFDLDSCEPHLPRRYLLIRQNLYDYIQMCIDTRRIDDHKYFWVDQVCIDQSSIAEKNHQVRLMERIYRYSEVVHAWLGNGSHPTVPAAGQKDYQVAELKHLAWTPEELGMNPYWNRLWILQEFILAREITIECGHRYLPGYALGLHAENDMPSVMPWMLRTRAIREQGYDRPQSLYDCFDNTADSKCEDPRDKIFGVQSLLAEEDRVIIDYAKTAPQVFLEGSATLLLSSRTRYFGKSWKSRLIGKSLKDLARCMYFFGRGMGVLASCGWVSVAQRLKNSDIANFIGFKKIRSGDADFEVLVELLRSMLANDLLE